LNTGSAALSLGLATLLLFATPRQVNARHLTDIFKNELAGLELEPIGPALANAVAQTYPVASASSSLTYVYDPASDTFERRTRVLGPIVGDRAETVGKGQIDIDLSYSYVRLKTINGEDLGRLENQSSIGGSVVSFPVPGGTTLADGRFTNFLPVHVQADLTVQAQIFTPAVTYGITPDLDVNLSLPLVWSHLRTQVHTEVPDPRLPQFALNPGDPNAMQRDLEVSNDAFGPGDLLLRAKYALLRERLVDVAALLGLSLPTGEPRDLQGTGTTRVQPTLIVSRVIAERFEPLLNVGVDINADNVDRSIVRWAVGGTAQVYGPLTGAVVFLGRNELSAQSDKIATPFFFQIERNDIYDVSLGTRLLLGENGIIAANAIVPLNRDGFRANVIPTVEVEYAF
jgi:hypothetical protein